LKMTGLGRNAFPYGGDGSVAPLRKRKRGGEWYRKGETSPKKRHRHQISVCESQVLKTALESESDKERGPQTSANLEGGMLGGVVWGGENNQKKKNYTEK